MENLLNQRKMSIFFGALVILGIGIYFGQQIAEKKEQDGKSALYKVEKAYEEELKALPEAERLVGFPLDVDTKFSKTVSELSGMISAKRVSDRILFEASLKLGTMYLDHGQPEKAAEAYKKGTTFASGSFQKASSFYVLGTAQERANQLKEAVESFQQGLSKNVDGLSSELMLGLVRDYGKLNDNEKAKLYAEKLKKDLPGSKAAMAAQELVKQ